MCVSDRDAVTSTIKPPCIVTRAILDFHMQTSFEIAEFFCRYDIKIVIAASVVGVIDGLPIQ